MTHSERPYEQGREWLEVWINDVDGWTIARKFHGGQHVEAKDCLRRWVARGVASVLVVAVEARTALTDPFEDAR